MGTAIPAEKPVAELNDHDSELKVMVYKAHGHYHGYYRVGRGPWEICPNTYKSVMGTIRAAYVVAVHVQS
jgi:hypothetical protein